MTTTNNDNRQKDPELREVLESIRQLKPASTTDVTDAVMQRIASMPQTVKLQPTRRPTMRFVSSLAAACFAGIAVVTFVISHKQGAQAANISPEMPTRLYDIYQYCNNYADEESIENAAFYENPMSDFF